MFPAVYGVLTGAGGFVGALDGVGNLIHVYDLARRWLSSYEGALVRLRRSSDSAQMDFGYDDNGDLDTAAITTWLGGANGFVVTIYDQAGSNNPTQATAGLQPAYVASGKNGHDIGRYDGTAHILRVAFSAATSQPITVYSVGKLDVPNDGITRLMYDGDDSTNRTSVFQNHGATPDGWAMFAGTLVAGSATDSNWHIFTFLSSGGSSQLWKDGTSDATGNAGAANLDGITIGGSFAASSNRWDGDITTLIIADPSHDTSTRQAVEAALNSYWSVY